MRKDARDWIILALIIGGAWLWIGKGCAEDRAEREAAEVATLRTNLLQARADSAGWETRLPELGAHPRVRGDVETSGRLRARHRGSPPRARGRHRLQVLDLADLGLTPVGAGTS